MPPKAAPASACTLELAKALHTVGLRGVCLDNPEVVHLAALTCSMQLCQPDSLPFDTEACNVLLLQDSQDPNPLIRALAVRTMGCIRVDKITEYLCDPLQRCLKVQTLQLTPDGSYVEEWSCLVMPSSCLPGSILELGLAGLNAVVLHFNNSRACLFLGPISFLYTAVDCTHHSRHRLLQAQLFSDFSSSVIWVPGHFLVIFSRLGSFTGLGCWC